MTKVARFEKVSYDQFYKDWKNTYPYDTDEEIEQIYKDIKLPTRATSGSAGYDFFMPCDFNLYEMETAKIPTGIRAYVEDGWVLKIYPRSGLGFKYRMQLDNTVGIIDSDYYHSDNEGHIMIKVSNDSYECKEIELKTGQGFAQGIFVEYGITFDDNTVATRNGGFGSTDKEVK